MVPKAGRLVAGILPGSSSLFAFPIMGLWKFSWSSWWTTKPKALDIFTLIIDHTKYFRGLVYTIIMNKFCRLNLTLHALTGQCVALLFDCYLDMEALKYNEL